jgi:SAM-dependent methyltransferase
VSLESIAEFYDKNGEHILESQRNSYISRYENLANIATLSYVEHALMPKRLARGVNFLDLCCGTGISSIYPAKVGYQVWGVDASPKSIEAARWLAKINGVEHTCHFEIAEAIEYLRSTKVKFDVIFVWGALYYLDLERTLPLIRDRLNPGGAFICVETNGSNLIMNGLRRIQSRFRRHRDDRTLNCLLRMRDYREIAKYFDKSQMRLFYCFALASVLLSWNRTLAINFHKAAQTLDYFVLNVLGLDFLAFKVVFQGQKFSSVSS